MPQLFPVFDSTPVLTSDSANQIPVFKPDFLFDYVQGDFVLDGAKRVQIADGYTAWRQWCIKQMYIVRYALLGYNNDAGIDYNLFRAQTTREAQEVVLAKSITDALKIDSRTDDVANFSFEWEGDSIWVAFEVTASDGTNITLDMTLPAAA
jgi:hypothetical protein